MLVVCMVVCMQGRSKIAITLWCVMASKCGHLSAVDPHSCMCKYLPCLHLPTRATSTASTMLPTITVFSLTSIRSQKATQHAYLPCNKHCRWGVPSKHKQRPRKGMCSRNSRSRPAANSKQNCDYKHGEHIS